MAFPLVEAAGPTPEMASNLQDSLAARDARGARSDGLQYRRRLDRSDEGVELGACAGQLDRIGAVSDIDDAAAKNLRQALHFFPVLACGADLDQHEFALDVRRLGQVDDLHHLDQLVQ